MSKNIKYCTECGSKIEYGFAPPKFCANCGTSIGRQPSVSISTKSAPKAQGKFQAISEDETDADFVPQLDKIKGTVEYDDNVFTLNGNDEKGLFIEQAKFEKRTKELDG